MTERDLLTHRRRGPLGWPSKPRLLKTGDTSALVRSRPSRDPSPLNLTATQEYFLEWNAHRLRITYEESRDRYQKSWSAVPGGHSGRAFGRFHRHCYDIFRVFANDDPTEVIDAYQLHAPVHFLTMLTYPEPQWFDDDFIVKHFRGRAYLGILDFGCGLAQQSRTLAEYMAAKGVEVRLTLTDIPTVRKDFLLWWGTRTGISLTFLDCTAAAPIPALPPSDLCFAVEFFEHVHDPLAYFYQIDRALSGGGLLITNISDHHEDFMHVSPKLTTLRNAVRAQRYHDVLTNFIFSKPRQRQPATV
jgi:SAM-dependent methyltransferase